LQEEEQEEEREEEHASSAVGLLLLLRDRDERLIVIMSNRCRRRAVTRRKEGHAMGKRSAERRSQQGMELFAPWTSTPTDLTKFTPFYFTVSHETPTPPPLLQRTV
jgi:hypothetical protein